MPRAVGPGLVGVVLLLAACGVPGDGTVTHVDDADVPYRLLEPAHPSGEPAGGVEEPGPAPSVFWQLDERLVPEATDFSCADRPDELVTRLLATLTEGPSDSARAEGRSTALPPIAEPVLVALVDGVAQIEVGPDTPVRADRLPVAVGQIVLTASSAPGVTSVVILADGEPAPAPLPDGVLADVPVTSRDYAALIPARYADALGCSQE